MSIRLQARITVRVGVTIIIETIRANFKLVREAD